MSQESTGDSVPGGAQQPSMQSPPGAGDQVGDLPPPDATAAMSGPPPTSPGLHGKVKTNLTAPGNQDIGTPAVTAPTPAAPLPPEPATKWSVSPKLKTALIIAGGVAGVLTAAYAGTAFAVKDTIPRTAKIGTVDVGGLSSTEATTKVAQAAGQLATKEVVVAVDDRKAVLRPGESGLAVKPEQSVQQLVGFTLHPAKLWGKLTSKSTVDFVVKVDRAALTRAVEQATTDLNSDPQDGSITFEGTVEKVSPAVIGKKVDIAKTVDLIKRQWTTQVEPLTAQVSETAPDIDQADVEQAIKDFVKPALSGPVTINLGGKSVVAEPADFAETLSVTAEDGKLVGSVDAAKLRTILMEKNKELGKEPQDAKIKLVAGKPTVVPSVAGVTIDESSLREGFLTAIKSPERAAEVTTAVAEPELTTAKAEALGVTKVMTKFTSKLPNKPVRTHNIRLAARSINGTLLKPGETFSMNKVLGRRTAAKGYKSAPVIMNGRLTKDYGGGISQVATTLFNGMFFAGLDEIQHKPHSFYISRYPEGREATVNYPTVDLKFKNDTKHGVLIEIWVAGGAVHTRFWGQKEYDEIKSVKSRRTAVVAPKEIEDDRPECVSQSPSPGFKVSVTRVFMRGGSEVKRETFRHRYIPEDKVTCTHGE